MRIGKFKAKIQQRKEDSFWGFQNRQLMDKWLPMKEVKVTQDLMGFYITVSALIDKWFDFSPDNVIVKFNQLAYVRNSFFLTWRA